MFSGTNLPRVGTYNVNVVLSSVQASEGISRVEIAQQTGLTAQTVSVIVRRLIQQGIVEESGSLPSKGASQGGRCASTRPRPTRWASTSTRSGVSMVVVDMTGQGLPARVRRSPPGSSPRP